MFGIILSICLLWAAAAAAAAWSFRDGFSRRLERDVAWLEEVRLRFSPSAENSRLYVQIAYFVHCVLLLPLLHFLIPAPFLGIGIWLCLWLLPQRVADLKWMLRLRHIDEQLPQTVRKLAALCGAGLAPSDALQQLAQEAPLPIRYEYRVMAREWEMGADLEGIVALASQRLELESFRLFAAVIEVNNQLGGNLVKTLEDLANSLSAQLEMRREVSAALAEGRMNIYGLLLAPPVMLGIVTIIDSHAVGQFFTTGLGMGIFSIAMMFIVSGALWARSIARIDV